MSNTLPPDTRLLLIDDHQIYLDGLSLTLGSLCEGVQLDHAHNAAEALQQVSEHPYDLILLDELNIALKYDYIDLDRVLDDLQARPEMQHVVVTGRGAPQELIDLADTVTEMGVVKHAFKDQGIKAQKGVEL